MKKKNRMFIPVVCMVLLTTSLLYINADTACALSGPETPALEKVVSYNYQKIKLVWKPVPGADGYQIYRSSSETGPFKKIASVDNPEKTYYINSGRTTGKRYWYKVRAFDKQRKKIIHSKFSVVKSTYARPVKVKNLTAEWQPQGGYLLQWQAVKGADGYQVAVRQKGDTAWRKSWYYRYGPTYEETIFVGDINVDGTSATVGTGNCEYEFKVRAYRMANSKRVYGRYSDVFKPEPQVTAEELKTAAENYIMKNYPGSQLSDSAGRTPENSGWGPTWPKSFSKYMNAEKILDMYLAEALDFYADNFWNAAYGGVPSGSIFVRETDNCYAVWWLA